MRQLLAALAIAATMSTGAAFGQSTTGTMDVGLSMLELAASKEFSQLGIDVDPMSLSLSQLSTIKGVLQSSDYSRTEKKQQVEAIIRRED